MRGLKIAVLALTTSGCVLNSAPRAEWGHDAYEGKEVLTSMHMAPTPAGRQDTPLDLQLIHVKGDTKSVLVGTYFGTVQNRLHNLDCRTVEFAADGQPFQPVAVTWSQTVQAQVRFTAELDPARVGVLGKTHELKVRLCGDEYAVDDGPWHGAYGRALGEFANALAQGDPAAIQR